MYSFCDLYSCEELFALFLYFVCTFWNFEFYSSASVHAHCSFSSWNVLFIYFVFFWYNFTFFFAYRICYSFPTTVFFCCCLVLYLGFLNNVISYLLQFFWLFFMTLLCYYILSSTAILCMLQYSIYIHIKRTKL